MKIELKNVNINLRFSEETTMFRADIYVDGKKAGYAENEGRGGNTNWHWYPEPGMRELMVAADAYCKTLPDYKYDDDLSVKMSLEQFIDVEIDKKVEAKENSRVSKKLAKDMVNNVVWGIPGGSSYRMWGFKVPLTQVYDHPAGRVRLNQMVADIQQKLLPGEEIFNPFIKDKYQL